MQIVQALPQTSPCLEILDCRRNHAVVHTSLLHVVDHCLHLRVLRNWQNLHHERLELAKFADGWYVVVSIFYGCLTLSHAEFDCQRFSIFSICSIEDYNGLNLKRWIVKYPYVTYV